FSAVPNKVSAFISRKPPVNTRRTTNAGDLISSLFSAERIPPADIVFSLDLIVLKLFYDTTLKDAHCECFLYKITQNMDNTVSIKEEAPQPLPLEIFEIPGEPAVVINGVPDEPQTDSMIAKDEPKPSSATTVGCGEWLEGREVRKFFLGQYYSGTVTKFDKSTGWYMVEYEDGDSEELDWSELEEVLLPMDVTVPLRSISLWILKNRQTQAQAYGSMPKR
ncbi:hypothetical protein IGI04_014313, partial [Brassica rapa subsp. trilocularis]